MIYGVKQKESGTDKNWDYVACLFPEGNIDLMHTYLFNHDQIDKIYYLGLNDQEQYEFNKEIKLTSSKSLSVENVGLKI